MSELRNGCLKKSTNRCHVHKFGGSSLADASCYKRVAAIITNYCQPFDIIIVSAAGKTTNKLIQWSAITSNKDCISEKIKGNLLNFQCSLINKLILTAEAKILVAALMADVERITILLQSINLLTEAEQAEIAAYGEVWSARLLSAVLREYGRPAQYIDARRFLVVKTGGTLPVIDSNTSKKRLLPLLQKYSNQHLVITGFIAACQQKKSILLGRNGSDYSATQIAALSDASQVTLWSDVAGVYSADPKFVPDAKLLPKLSLAEASELARLSIPLLHSRTLQPIIQHGIHLHLRSSYLPDGMTTRIVSSNDTDDIAAVKLLTSHDDITMIRLCCDSEAWQSCYQTLRNYDALPLAFNIESRTQSVQLYYIDSFIKEAQALLKRLNDKYVMNIDTGYALIALVGSQVGYQSEYQQQLQQLLLKNMPLTTFCQAENGLSLIAIIKSTTVTPCIMQKIHHHFFVNNNSSNVQANKFLVYQ